MKVRLLAPELPSSDPSDPIARHAAGLAHAGHDVALGITDDRPSGPGLVQGVRAVAVEDLLDASTDTADVAIATSWDAAACLFELPATRHALWVDGFGFERLGAWQAERIAALIAYDLPVDFLCAAPWVKRALEHRRPEARALLARNGLDHDRFGIEDRAQGEGPLHVLVDPRGAGAEAVAQAGVAVTVTELEETRREAQYADADVLLMLDPVDGVLTTPLEAARAGVVPIVLPAGGQEDLVEHLVSGIVATPEDARGTGRWLARLDGDRELLGRLRSAARERASAWPSWDDASDELEGALATLMETPPPDAAAWPTRLMADAMAGVATYRNEHYVLAEELRSLQQDDAVRAARKLRGRLEGTRAAPLVRSALRRLR